MMTNIIKFPLKEKLEESKLFDDLTDEQKSEALRELCSDLLGDLIEVLNAHGYWLDEDRDTASLSMVFDSLHSMMLGVEGIQHPFQGIAQMMYDPENAGAEMTVVLTDIED